MSAAESRAAFSLAGIFSFRMLGLFMIYPVFALYADHLPGHSDFTVGLALGVYGFTQALLQIPFGFLSDRVGRKPIITMGLLIFAVGSVVAALATNIYGVIIGRLIQGGGAVGSTILALGADLTREEHRTKAMAIIGMVIGFSFAVALVLGPIFNAWFGVSGIFWLTAVLALLGIGILHVFVPQPEKTSLHRDTEAVPNMFKRVLTNPELLRFDFGIFAMHVILIASFVVLPVQLGNMGTVITPKNEWMFYLPILLVSVFAMVPLIIIAERGRMKPVFLGGIVALGVSQLALAEWQSSIWLVGIALTVFFTAFNLMEASLPSLISKVAAPESKGTAMGVYSSSQFLGIFVGGAVGGWIQGQYGASGVFAMTTIVAALWFVFAFSMQRPPAWSTRLLNVGARDAEAARDLEARLKRIPGVASAVVEPDEGVAYLKVEKNQLDEAALNDLAAAG